MAKPCSTASRSEESCRDEFFSVGFGSGPSPCLSNSLICSQLREFVKSGREMCEKFGFAVDADQVKCFDGRMPPDLTQPPTTKPWDWGEETTGRVHSAGGAPENHVLFYIFVPCIVPCIVLLYIHSKRPGGHDGSDKAKLCEQKNTFVDIDLTLEDSSKVVIDLTLEDSSEVYHGDLRKLTTPKRVEIQRKERLSRLARRADSTR